MAQDTKKVRVMFCGLSSQNEGAIRRFINQALLLRPIALQSAQGYNDVFDPTRSRDDVRMELLNTKIKVSFVATKSLPSRSYLCELIDISSGGVCIALPKEIPLAVGGGVVVALGFIAPDLAVQGEILGLKSASDLQAKPVMKYKLAR